MIRHALALLPLIALGLSCAPDPDEWRNARGDRVEIYFNEPGTSGHNMWEPDAIPIMQELIQNARTSIDFAVMGFNRAELIYDLIAAHDRGVRVRMVGDAKHQYNYGYQRFRERRLPLTIGNSPHIMHNKFMVVDGRFTFGGTANWTNTDLRQNSNNFFLIDNPGVANDFTDEFNQMFNGRFGHTKVENDNGRTYQVDDTTVEVWFAPQEDAMGRILELLDAAERSIYFTIFAFTKDQVGSAFIRKQAEFRDLDAAEGIEWGKSFRGRRGVAGVIDKSQMHSNGQSHEVFRLLGAGVPLRIDANENSQLPGDYQAGGGRLHSKTMLIDIDGENPIVITGSFNWSAAATQSNDEYLLVFHGRRVANAFRDYFFSLWDTSLELGEEFAGRQGLTPGDVIINEVMWYGRHADMEEGFDQYIELRNRTNRWLRLDMWQLANINDFVVGIPPGSVIPPQGTYTILDHVLQPFQDGIPQMRNSAFTNGDQVLNSFNDNRQARLYLKSGTLGLKLLDPRGVVMDSAGDGGPAFAGGPEGDVVRSMERREDPGDGTLAEDWYSCTLEEGGANVNEPYKDVMIGTPGEPNSPEVLPDEAD